MCGEAQAALPSMCEEEEVFRNPDDRGAISKK